MNILTSTVTIVSPALSSALDTTLKDLLNLIAIGVMTLTGMGIRLWISNMKSGLTKMVALKLVSYAEQKFIDNAEKQKYVADELSKRFPRIASAEIQHILEAAVVELKNAQVA